MHIHKSCPQPPIRSPPFTIAVATVRTPSFNHTVWGTKNLPDVQNIFQKFHDFGGEESKFQFFRPKLACQMRLLDGATSGATRAVLLLDVPWAKPPVGHPKWLFSNGILGIFRYMIIVTCPDGLFWSICLWRRCIVQKRL